MPPRQPRRAGLVMIVAAFQKGEPADTRALFILSGLALVAFGVVLFTHPGIGVVTIALLFGPVQPGPRDLGDRRRHRAAPDRQDAGLDDAAAGWGAEDHAAVRWDAKARWDAEAPGDKLSAGRTVSPWPPSPCIRDGGHLLSGFRCRHDSGAGGAGLRRAGQRGAGGAEPGEADRVAPFGQAGPAGAGLTRLGIPGALAEVYADRLDWHEVARLVQRGCPRGWPCASPADERTPELARRPRSQLVQDMPVNR
jgi:hypothetical protein